MDRALQDYYEARFDMFASKGWKDLIEDIQNMKDANDTISGIDDLRKLGVRQGEIQMMDWILSIQKITEEVYEGLKEARNEAVA